MEEEMVNSQTKIIKISKEINIISREMEMEIGMHTVPTEIITSDGTKRKAGIGMVGIQMAICNEKTKFLGFG